MGLNICEVWKLKQWSPMGFQTSDLVLPSFSPKAGKQKVFLRFSPQFAGFKYCKSFAKSQEFISPLFCATVLSLVQICQIILKRLKISAVRCVSNNPKRSHDIKNGKNMWQCHPRGGGSPPVHFSSPNLTDPQNTRELTLHTWNFDARPPTIMSAYFQGKFNFHDSFWDGFLISGTNGNNLTNTENAH